MLNAIVFATSEGKPLDMLKAQTKQFKSGSDGFYAGGKVEIDGTRYQVSCSVVRVGSKPKDSE